MTRQNSNTSTSPFSAGGPAKRLLAVSLCILCALMLILTIAIRPMAFAQGDEAQVTNGKPTAGELIAGQLSGATSATVLVYLNGSDLESYAGEASADISEMLDSGSGSNVNVVIETLGTSEWQDHGIASDHTQRYLVDNGKLRLVDDSLGQLASTSADTLADFISWGAKNYPADRYILVMWDHGAGPVYGFGYDEFQPEGEALTLDEMQKAFAANPDVHFDIIGMDCCIMSSLETCLVLQPYCDYTILSEDFEPGIGWSYEGWLSMLEKNPGIETRELGTAIVDDMVKAVAADKENGEATLALIDESKADELYTAWVTFAYANEGQLLGTNYSQEIEWQGRPGEQDGFGRVPGDHAYEGYGKEPVGGQGSGLWESPFAQNVPDAGSDYQGHGGNYGNGFDYGTIDWEALWGAWEYDGSFVTMTDYFITDIETVASSIESAEASALKQAQHDAIVHFNATSGEEGMGGMGVTLPYGDAEFYDELAKVFKACGIDGDYVDWLESFVGVESANGSVADGYGFDGGYGYLFGEGYDGGYGYGASDGYGFDGGFGYGYQDEAYGYGYGIGGNQGLGHGYGIGGGHGSGYDYGYGMGHGYGFENSYDENGYGFSRW